MMQKIKYASIVIVLCLFLPTKPYADENNPDIQASINKIIESCFLAEPHVKPEDCEKYSNVLKNLSATIADSNKSINLKDQSKYEADKAKYEAKKAEFDAVTSELDNQIKQVEVTSKNLTMGGVNSDYKKSWRNMSINFLIGIDIFFAIITFIVVVFIARSKSDLTSILKEPGPDGKWSFSRFIGFFGGLFGFAILMYLFNVSIFHLLYFDILPVDSQVIIGAIGTFVSTQIPYIVKQLSGQA